MSINDWGYNHPLFSNGIFLFPTINSKGDFEPTGWYNPVVDSIFFKNTNEEVWYHEVTHRIFSIFGGDFIFIRFLAGISHSLIYSLLEIIKNNKIHIEGSNLGTLQATQSGTDKTSKIIERIKQIENVYDQIFWKLVPATEIAAIDFLPEGNTLGWPLKFIPETNDIHKRKFELIRGMTELLSNESHFKLLYENPSTKIAKAWTAYSSIDNPIIRKNLLRLVMSNAKLKKSKASKEGNKSKFEIVPSDTVELIVQLVQYAGKPLANEAFRKEAAKRIDKIWGQTDLLIELALDDIPDISLKPLERIHSIALLLLFSATYKGTPIQYQLKYSKAIHPVNTFHSLFSLLTFWIENEEKHRVAVNTGYLHTIEQQLISDKWTLEQDWWRKLSILEVIRLSLKKGKPVTCPFIGWDGIDCIENCPIKEIILIIKTYTEIPVNECLYDKTNTGKLLMK